MLVQTVATTSYLPMVATLLGSIKEYMPDASVAVLVTDAERVNVPSIKNFLGADTEVLIREDLGLDFLDQMLTYYNVLEFNSACKVIMLHYQLVTKNVSECLFLDPDILVMHDIQNLLDLFKTPIVAFPHALAPFPQDDELPNDFELTISGHLNGGFLFIRNSEMSLSALKWLYDKTRYSWFVAPQYGMYADQQWLSALPYYFHDAITVGVNPGANIAYWNLHERPLRMASGKYFCGNDPVYYFHMSGFTIPSQGRLTKHSRRTFGKEKDELIHHISMDYESRLKNQQSTLRAKNIFTTKPLHNRMRIAERLWGIKYTDFSA